MNELFTPRLRALARRSRVGLGDRLDPDPEAAKVVDRTPAHTPDLEEERCDLCGERLGVRHGHLVDVPNQALRCVCRACAILFDKAAAGGDHFSLVPDEVRLLEDFQLSDMDWVALRIPVDLAFFFHSSAAGRVVALYPGPMGATESLLGLEHWARLERDNPALADMEPDVMALLVNRTRGRRQGWLVPIDACYELVAVFRTRWKGLSGGSEVWEGIEDFFQDLRRRAGTDGSAQA